MDPQPFPTESSLPSTCFNDNLFQDSDLLLIHNDEPCSQADHLDQLKGSLFAQPQVSSSGDPKVEESEVLLRKVKEIDIRLNQGWFFAYELWLCFIIIAVPLKGVIVCELMYYFWFWDKALSKISPILLILTLYYIFWAVQQALLHGKALWKKDQKIAAKAHSSVVKLAIYYFVLYAAFFLMSIFWRYSDSEGEAYLWNYIRELSELFVFIYVIPVGISVYGSYKVKVLLEEKIDLLLKAGKDDGSGSAQTRPQNPQRILL